MGFTETVKWLSVYWTTVLAIFVFTCLCIMTGYACRIYIYGVQDVHVRNPMNEPRRNVNTQRIYPVNGYSCV